MFLFQKNFFIKAPKRPSPNWGAFYFDTSLQIINDEV